MATIENKALSANSAIESLNIVSTSNTDSTAANSVASVASVPSDPPIPIVVPFDILKIIETLKQSAYQVAVVKFGGNAIGNEQVLDALIDDTIALARAGVHVMVVHGGGQAVNNALAAVGKETKKINGLRVTDSETLDVAVKVFSQINEYLADKFRKKGVSALGFCPKSAIPFETEKMDCQDISGSVIDLGWVGEIVGVNSNSLESWMRAGWIPIVAPIGLNAAGEFYNINADHAAFALATEIQCESLIFMTDVPGVLQNIEDPSTRIGHLTAQNGEALVEQGAVSGGMLPKIKSCLKALDSGIDRIAILNSFEPYALLKGFIAPQETGTLITGDKHDY